MKTKKYFVALSIIFLTILAILISSNVYLFQLSTQYYTQLNYARLDPLGLNYYPSVSSQNVEPDSDTIYVVLFGDSRAAAWPIPSISGFEFINRGIDAQTSAQVVRRYDDHVRMLNPDILVVQVCINDLKTIPLFPEQKKAIVSNCKDNIQQIVRQARDQETIVILSTIFPVGQIPVERKLFWSGEIPEAVDEVNSYINSLAGEGVVVFDTFSILANERGKLRQEYSQDELHLNTGGYEIINRESEQLLKSNIVQ